MANQYATHGVYIQELNAFPDTLVSVPTSITAFIGYTEKNELKGRPVMIQSLAEYEQYFGTGPGTARQFTISPVAAGTIAAPLHTILALGNQTVEMGITRGSYRLYQSIRFFFMNGGSSCYIISAGDYTEPVGLAALAGVLPVLEKITDASILVIPESVCVSAGEHDQLMQLSLAHCSNTKNKVVILDVYDGAIADDTMLDAVVNDFRNGTGMDALNYGAVYFPWLRTGLTARQEISFMNLPADFGTYLENTPEVAKALSLANPLKQSYAGVMNELLADNILVAQNSLLAASNHFKQLMDAALDLVNLVPPSAAIAGLYGMVDSREGVWRAPANISVTGALAPSVLLTDTQQMQLMVDATTGKSINAIRAFPMKGVLVWGARTLDGNSNDWRYINVRRTLIMIEQSVLNFLKPFVFSNNDASTWATIKAGIENYLNGFWKSGGLNASKAEDAFMVNIGLGVTMTAEDILDGNLKVMIMLAVSHPAEFIEISFQQQMQKS